jgi:hypothetical protein
MQNIIRTSIFVPCGATAQIEPKPPYFRGPQHTRLDIRLLWTSYQPIAKAATYTTHNRPTSTPSAGFEPATRAIKRPQTHALDRRVKVCYCASNLTSYVRDNRHYPDRQLPYTINISRPLPHIINISRQTTTTHHQHPDRPLPHINTSRQTTTT